ncbi:protein YLS7-like [Tasmannia lanceolata]|uniref:protein YLS7-like n=1 Tax=Tasmannia lanceolata TaxID=3420 RepID=UPI004062CD5C
MKQASVKVLPTYAFPRTISSIAISVGGLAVFLVLASWLLISYPIGSTKKLELGFLNSNQTGNLIMRQRQNGHQDVISKSGFGEGNGSVPSLSFNATPEAEPTGQSISPNYTEAAEIIRPSVSKDSSPNYNEAVEIIRPSVSEDSQRVDSGASDTTSGSSSDSTMTNSTATTPILTTAISLNRSVNSGNCDLYHGKWVFDPKGPLYTNNTCPIITQMQNCQGNGRPDKDYESFRWKPDKCDLPRFDVQKFMELMRGKTLAFVGDSVSRNQMESLLCILWQGEAPINRGNRKMHRWWFRSANISIVRIWSSWLVHTSSEPFQFAPKDIVKLHLDTPDETFMDFLPTFHVVVLSSGHWFAKQSVYLLNNEILGWHLWNPDKTRGKTQERKINNVEAFSISVETSLTAMVTHPNYTGLTIVRSYSPDHYEGGAWNTGGSCTGRVRPATESESVVNGFTDEMHRKQVKGFETAIKKASNRSKLRLMDITDAFGYRSDGHPGPYRSLDPNKVTKRGPHGEPPPQDCLHWCMPGPVDTWNELLLEIIRREFEG